MITAHINHIDATTMMDMTTDESGGSGGRLEQLRGRVSQQGSRAHAVRR